MTQTTTTIDIERPAETVFDYIADMENNPTWQQGQLSCRWTSEQPIDVGSTYEQEATFLGRTIRSTFRVAEFEHPRRIRIVTTGGTMPIDVTREVAVVDETTSRISATVCGDPPPMLRLLGPLLDVLLRRSVASDYRRLKHLLESAPATGVTPT